MILEGNSELHRKMKIAGDGKYLSIYLKYISLFTGRITPLGK